MSDSGCYLLGEGKACAYPGRVCDGGFYGASCEYYWFWEGLDEESDWLESEEESQ